MRHATAGILAAGLMSWAGSASAIPFAYISNSGDGTLSVIDTATNTVVATVPVGSAPAGGRFSPTGTRFYVANSGDNTVSVVDTVNNSVVGTLAVGTSPIDVAVTPSGTRLYVTDSGDW